MTATSKQLTMKRWVLFTTYGWFIGILLVVGFAIVAELLIKMDDESGGQAAVGIGMGAGVGFMHWMAIRKYLASSSGLFWYSMIGFSLAFIFRDLIVAQLNTPISVEITIPFAVLLGAFISAWLQYAYLLKKVSDKAAGWISHSITGWLLATFITMGASLMNFKLGDNLPKAFVVLFALTFLSIGGPILGYITGRFIVPKINGLNKNNRTNANHQITSIGGDVQM